ncbi:3632_t:CDS:10 [Entrophospora sp. SA101]|nr:3632_t:CDS:10 [Entrophospora sp. SA101]
MTAKQTPEFTLRLRASTLSRRAREAADYSEKSNNKIKKTIDVTTKKSKPERTTNSKSSTLTSSPTLKRTRRGKMCSNADSDDDGDDGDDEDPSTTTDTTTNVSNKGKSKVKTKPSNKGKSRSSSSSNNKGKVKSDYESEQTMNNESSKENKKKSKASKSKKEKEGRGRKSMKFEPYDPILVKELANEFPDRYWEFNAESGYGMVNYINEQYPLELIKAGVQDQGPITGMILSPDGTMLVTFCNIGCVRIWDVNDFQMLQKLIDTEEKQIDEYYVGRFIPSQTHIVVGGKVKDRHKWSPADEDNHILPCPLKIFDVITGKCIGKLEGHAEEILCIKTLMFNGEPYYITSSQDGYIIKWKMEDDWITLIDKKHMADGITCMAFTVSFVPNTGNKYFLAATDDTVRLYDFEAAQCVQSFDSMYTQYCDCGKFINPVEPMEEKVDDDVILVESSKKAKKRSLPPQTAYYVTRGVELLDLNASRQNVCKLFKLIYPTKKGGKFELKEVREYQHKKTGKVSGILQDHERYEIRDVLFHPWKPLLFTCDGYVKIYTYKNRQEYSQNSEVNSNNINN